MGIATRFNVGVFIAVPAIILCINRRLYLLASPTSVIPSKEENNRELIIDLVIGIGLPMIGIGLCLSSKLSLSVFGLFIFSVYHSKPINNY